MNLHRKRMVIIRSIEGKRISVLLVKIKNILRKPRLIMQFAKSTQQISLSPTTIKEYNNTRTNGLPAIICHAPFTNMYFGYGGKIGVCCYNRTHLLGTYPSTGIMQAWKGKDSVELRKKIKTCDLTAGCYCCQVQWVEKAYHTVLARNYDGFKPHKTYPVSMEFELSNRCNLQCIMCSEENSSAIAKERFGQTEKIYPYDDAFVNQLDEFIPYLKSTKFLGGEPFLIPIYYKIWDRIITLNPDCEIVIQTNGTVLNEKIKTLLQKGNFSINISIDSLVKETYEEIRKPARFEEVFQNLMWFIDCCKTNKRFIGIACCFMQQNHREIPELIRFFNKYQVTVTFNRVWEPPNCSIWESSYKLTSEILAFYKIQDFETCTSIEQKNVAAFNDLINLVSQWNDRERIKSDSKFKSSHTTIDKLEDMIDKHLFSFDPTSSFSQEEKAVILYKFQNGLAKYKNHSNYKVLLLKILEIPSEILQREILNNSEERIEQHIKNIIDHRTDD